MLLYKFGIIQRLVNKSNIAVWNPSNNQMNFSLPSEFTDDGNVNYLTVSIPIQIDRIVNDTFLFNNKVWDEIERCIEGDVVDEIIVDEDIDLLDDIQENIDNSNSNIIEDDLNVNINSTNNNVNNNANDVFIATTDAIDVIHDDIPIINQIDPISNLDNDVSNGEMIDVSTMNNNNNNAEAIDDNNNNSNVEENDLRIVNTMEGRY